MNALAIRDGTEEKALRVNTALRNKTLNDFLSDSWQKVVLMHKKQ